MRGKSKKVLATEEWVDKFIAKNKYPPTYVQIGKQFDLYPSAAYARCKKFRDKMGMTKSAVVPQVVPYQACPICKGHGIIKGDGLTNYIFKSCPVCNGQRIIPMHVIK